MSSGGGKQVWPRTVGQAEHGRHDGAQHESRLRLVGPGRRAAHRPRDPGTLPAIGHARGLVLLARGEVPAAYQALQAASESWQARRRFWEGTLARLDLAAAAARARRPGEAAVLVDEVRAEIGAWCATVRRDTSGEALDDVRDRAAGGLQSRW
jgi:hypothetical protein